MRIRDNAVPAARLWMQGVSIFLLALALYALGASTSPIRTDEYYTLLAAHSYADEGIPRIWDGVYVRAVAFTAIVAASLSAFGDSLFAARLPALLPAALLVTLAFLWTGREAGTAAAWLLAAFLVLSKSAAAVAHYSRFYALHSLLFFLCAISVYLLLSPTARTRSPAWKSVMAITAMACAAAALHLQDTTLIGLAGLAAAGAVAVAFRRDVRARITPRGMGLALGLAVVLLVVLALLMDVPDELARLYAKYRWVALWNAENQNNAWYYLQQLERQLPVFFYTYPLAVLVAVGRAPRATVFSVVLTTAALALQSFGGMKSLHYIHYLWPFLLFPAAVASARLASLIARALIHSTARWAAPALPPAMVRVGTAGMVTVAFLIALLGNRDYDRIRVLPQTAAAEFGLGAAARSARSQASAEREAVDALNRLVSEAGYLVSSSDLQAVWHLGRLDVVLRPTRLSEITPSVEFARDPRTGAVVIGQPDSLARIMECQPHGILVVWEYELDWRRPHAVTDAVADLIERTMQPVELPETSAVRAFRWRPTVPVSADCERVPRPRSAQTVEGSTVD